SNTSGGLSASGTIQYNPMGADPHKASAGDPSKSDLSGTYTFGSSTGGSGVGDFELLGDLQLKQGRVQEAIQAYQKAVGTLTDRKRQAALYQKMAQASLSVNDTMAAHKALAKAIEYLNLLHQKANTSSPSVTVPATVIPT